MTMPRADLLALSLDDLAAMTNRGTVKRAQREVEAGEATAKLQETPDGTVTAKWSDGVTCVLPGGAVAAAGRCSCPATDLCRHIVRTVLAYQKRAAGDQSTDARASWNPGDLTDEALATLFKPAVINQARRQFENGLLVELVRGHKPIARFHDLACTLRFQVPGDARYVHCDCAADPPCIHVPLAVWAFRSLAADKNAAILSTQAKPLPVPTRVLDRIDEVLLNGLEFGLSEATGAVRDRLARLERQCRDAGLIWPAEVLVEMIGLHERYAEHDARFSPERLAELVGELLIRGDAIRRDTGAVPQLFVRGTARDHWTDLASARFIGLGCGARLGRRSASLVAYLQDADSGSMVAITREFPDPPDGSPEPARPFWQLAQTPVVKGATIAQVGAGQLLTQGGKRATDHQLVLGRAKATVNPQNFSWENLRPPVLAESFAEIRSRLAVLPPAALRPRRVAEDFHVCRITGVERAAFLSGLQVVHALLKDAADDTAVLRQPYTSRGSEGTERLLARLTSGATGLQFVAGPMRLTAEGLCMEPVALIFQDSSRTMLQPWIDRWQEPHSLPAVESAEPASHEPVEEWGQELLKAVGELMVIGLMRGDPGTIHAFQELERTAELLGMARVAAAIGRIRSGVAQRLSTTNWKWQPTGRALLDLAVLARLAEEVA